MNTSPLFAYEEWSIPNLTAPTTINKMGIEVQFQHQFRGRIINDDPLSRLFGVGDGADASIGLRATVWRKAQVYAFYDNMQLFSQSHNEFTLGTTYAFSIPRIFLHLQVEGEVFSYASYLTYPEKRSTDFFLRGCFRNEPFFNRVSIICNVGYGFDEKAPGIGIGTDVVITEYFEIYGYYFPVWNKTDEAILQSNIHSPFSFGIKFTTHGHQFFIYAGNAAETGSRHLMQGTFDNHLRLGFMIKRLFDFSKSDS
jgi:hypothetical protein